CFGGMEISDGVTINRKVTHVSSVLGDLVAQARQISNSEMTNILDAATAVMTPYPTNTLKLVVSGIEVDSKGNGKVAWSDARNANPLAKGASVTLPESLAQPNSFLITAKVNYVYTPTIGYVTTGT